MSRKPKRDDLLGTHIEYILLPNYNNMHFATKMRSLCQLEAEIWLKIDFAGGHFEFRK